MIQQTVHNNAFISLMCNCVYRPDSLCKMSRLERSNKLDVFQFGEKVNAIFELWDE